MRAPTTSAKRSRDIRRSIEVGVAREQRDHTAER